MSFLNKNPQMPASTAQGASQVSSYREAEPVPLGFGRDWFPSHWLCAPHSPRTAYGGEQRPEWQYRSIAAGYCEGPIDFVGKVRINGEEYTNLDYTFSDGEESHEFILNDNMALKGAAFKLILHRGTEDALMPTALNAATGQTHPAYRGRCWAEWENIDLGQGTTALPDIQLELGRHTPAIGPEEGGFPKTDSHPEGVNPFAAIYALLTDEAGFGLSEDLIDAAHWAAQALALEASGVANRTGNAVRCHPVFKSAQEAISLLSTILAHVDGYLYIEDGKICVGWFPSQAPVGPLPEITEHDLEEAPSGGSFPDWNRGPASVAVICRAFSRNYNDTPVLSPAPANLETGVAVTPSRVERPMIHDEAQAAQIAAEISAARGSNEATVTLKVQKSRAVKGDGTPLMPGDIFVWDFGPNSLDLVMRVIGRRIRAGETADLIEAIPERGQFPLPYVAPVDDRVLPTPSAPGEIDVADVRLWLLPSELSGVRALVPLVNRAHRGIYRVDLHLSVDGSAPWSPILDARFFAAKCAVVSGISSGATTLQVTSTSVDIGRMAAQDANAQTDDTLLLLVGNELLSVGTITVVSPGTYELGILRGRRGTAAAAHAGATVGWMFYRSEIARVEHEEFYRVRDGSNLYNATIATKYFKLQLFTIDEAGLAKPDAGISLQLPDLSPDDSAGYTIVLTNEAHTVACDASGNVNAGQLGSGSNAQTDVKVYRGGTALTPVNTGPNSDQFSIALGTLTATTATQVDADTVRADSLTADSGTIQILITVAGAFTVPKLFSLSKSKAGAAGGAGAQGIPGPGLVYVGAYNAGTVYYYTPARRDVVSHSGSYYVTNNAAKSGTNSWGTPGGGDWSAPDATYKFVATDLLLANDVTILRTLVMGDGATSNAGTIRSHGATGFAAGTGFWLGLDGTTPKLRVGNPAGSYLSWDGTRVAGRFGSGSTTTLIDDNGISFEGPSSTGTQIGYSGGPYINLIGGGGNNLLMTGGAFSVQNGGVAMLKWDTASAKLVFTNDSNAALYRPGIGSLKTDGSFTAAVNLKAGANIEVVGNILAGGAVGDGRGIKYAGGTSNAIAFRWDGSNVRVIVDGSEQGTIPNP